jgi:hypothetical protein
VVIAITKFAGGAWMVILLVPILVFFLIRLAKRYEKEERELEVDAVSGTAHAPVRSRLVVLVLVDRVDLASARAMHFGRSLHPTELRAVHFVLDEHRAQELTDQWRAGGLGDMELELVECSDRRLPRAAMTAAARVVADGKSEVCIVLPDRQYGGLWRRILHDQTAESLARALSRLPHVTVTSVPFNLQPGLGELDVFQEIQGLRLPAPGEFTVDGNGDGNGNGARDGEPVVATRVDGAGAISGARLRQYMTLSGRVHSVRMSPIAGSPALECALVDDSGTISVVFFGRRSIPGIEVGARMTVEGMVGEHRGRLAFINPVYRLQP